jgi:mRNA-degrading endonuclease toxin of MazEF toxin-antitoxin module
MHGDDYGTLHCLLVSTVPVCEGDMSCLAVRVSVTREPRRFPYWVRLGSGDPGFGYVVVHDLDRVEAEELKEDLGELSTESMFEVERALKSILGL